MSAYYDHGPLRTYQVIWKSGHVEEIQAHQVILPAPALGMFGMDDGPRATRATFHGEFEGRWRLVLDVDYGDISSIRDVTEAEMPS